MEFRMLNEEFEVVDIIDRFESAIWTIRAKEAGDFEILAPVEANLLQMTTDAIDKGWYLFCNEFYNSKDDKANLMFIQTLEITSDPENGAKMKITGFDLKEILERRIIIGQKSFKSGTAINEVMKELIKENITEPVDWKKTYQDSINGNINIEVLASDRIIDNFIVIEEGTEFPTLTGDLQYEGETVYNIFTDLASNYKVSYDIQYNFTTRNFELRIFTYRDRTYDQTDYPPIIFSPGFENLKDSNYLETTSTERTFGLIIGEGDEYNKMYNVIGGGSGLSRKELGISATDVSRTKEDGTEYGNKTYLSMLYEKGQTEMNNNTHSRTYEGTAETTRGYSYPDDFTIGEVVEIINEWGISSRVLIDEIVFSISTSSINIIPTFSTIEEDNKSNTEIGGES